MKHAHQWPVATAKARFSKLLKEAELNGPQTVTRHGQPAIVVASVRDWERKARRNKSLVEFLMDSPLKAAELKTSGLKIKWRESGL